MSGLGISDEVLNSHRGWDIGAEEVARHLAERLDATLVLQRYSRLVIDANRPPVDASSIPEVSDGEIILGNRDLSAAQRNARIDEIFAPMDSAVRQMFRAKERRYAFSIHSFTRVLGGDVRPWHAGFLSRTRRDFARRLMDEISTHAPDLVLAVNQPYQIDDETDWFIPVHVEPRNIPHCLIEIGNDQISNVNGVTMWADFLADAILALMETEQ